MNVILGYIDRLNLAGYRAAPLYGAASYRYGFFDCSAPPLYHPALQAITRGNMGRKDRARAWLNALVTARKPAYNTKWIPQAEDVLVVPEFWYPAVSAAFPEQKRVLMVQDVFGLSRAFRRDQANHAPQLPSFTAALTASEATTAAVEYLCDLPCQTIPLSVTRPGLEYQHQKQRQIAYMPRKRSEESALVLAALKNRPALQGWNIVPIDGVGPVEVGRILSESLIFLSFSHQEGFGLPPAEAMATGAIVLGYSGVGGNEYFSDDVAIPVADGDLIGFAKTVEAVVTEYDADPARLDGMRKRASAAIWRDYSEPAYERALLQVWKDLHAQLT